ncbi:AIPR family protein [Microbacterium trichothecenolyticum]|uniref:AIPR family protein n=1 Tax=Microbacterium trichothecenolyticum TaxID=69370 RepID=UPI0035BE341F
MFDALASEVVLKYQDLSAEEVEAGLTDGGGDGGIDAAYVFLNQELVTEDHEVLQSGFTPGAAYRGASLSLWIVQAKEEKSFKSGTLVTVADGIGDLLDLQKSRADLENDGYSSIVLDRVFEFRNALVALRRHHPETSVHFAYVTLGDASSIAKAVQSKTKSLAKLVENELEIGTFTSQMIGAEEIWDALKQTPNYGSELRVVESFAHETQDGERSYVCLVTLKDYLAFVREEGTGAYRDYLFDGNVRHHEGSSASVNREISQGLADSEAPEFWWLNNGVTVICSKASSQGKTFALDDVQIVNGLQTSRTIFDSLRDAKADDPALARNVLVRIIESDDPATINRVIRATNRQTPVREESLRATDEVQLLIDRHMLTDGLFYDRRRNYYKNIGKPRAKIVGVRALTQAMLAVTLGRPDDARARPGDYLGDDKQYSIVFNPHVKVEIYPWAFRAQKLVDALLVASAGMTTSEKNDSRFLVAADIVRRKLGYSPSAAEQVLALGAVEEVITPEQVAASLGDLRKAFAKEMKKTGSARDRLAKSKPFASKFLGRRKSSKAP